MSDKALIEKLEAVDGSTDFTDPNTYAELLGYNDEPESTAQPQGETQVAAPATPAAAEGSSEAPAAAQQTETEPVAAGVATKDGKHVIPYSVLENERARARHLEAELARLKADGATAAQQTAAVESLFSQEELEDMALNAPEMSKLVNAYSALAAQVKAEADAKASVSAERQHIAEQEAADVRAATVQEAINALPSLKAWQSKGGALWAEAIALDKQMLERDEWAGKPQEERFAEVQRVIAEQYGIPLAATPANNKPAASAANKPAAPAPVKQVNPTLTDFGGTPNVANNMDDLAVGQMVDKVMTMDMEQIRRMAGLSY